MGANSIPTQLLMEKRAVTPAPADVGQTQDQIEGYVFPAASRNSSKSPHPSSRTLATELFQF